MSSPIPGSKKMPKTVPLPNFKKKPVLEVDPKPYPMPGILPDKPGAKKPTFSLGGGNVSKYRPIKNTKQVNKIYNTY